MHPVQRLFARLVAMNAESHRREAFVRDVFEPRGFDTSALEKPACWRRKPQTTGNGCDVVGVR